MHHDDTFPAAHHFDFKEEAKKIMLQNPKVNIQLRCIQLGEAMTHQMPKFGAFRLNNEKRTLQQYKIQDPPNNRKRKDKVMDLT
jgi:hypothetical protein